MSKHTPGEWKRDSLDRIVAVRGASVVVVARLQPDCNQYMDRGEINANVRLVEAAPKLLAALELAERWLSGTADLSDSRDVEDLRTIRAAIAKAKGG